jgi:hypothetical protein
MTTLPPSVAASVSATSLKRGAQHQRFSWLHDKQNQSTTATQDANAMDAFRGIETCLQLIEMSNLERESADHDDPGYVAEVLSMCDTGRLMRLAILVAKEWGDKYEGCVRGHNESQS